MFYKKKGLPEENAVVICTVKKILFHSIFVELDEFQNLEGMIHISEIAPGRIRNIRDYVKEGKKLVCQVLRVDKEKRQVDLSLRRVPFSLRNKKNEEYKQEIKSEKLLEYIGKELKIDLKTAYQRMGYALIEHFGLLGIAFSDISAEGMDAIKELKFPKEDAEVLVRIVQEKIKPIEVEVHTTLSLQSFTETGVEEIKKALHEGELYAKKHEINAHITYISAPKYRVEVFSTDYKTGEEELEEVCKVIVESVHKAKGTAEVLKKK
ncbi:translation initiation factor IF-2 subunit alpha [Candidatus Woesearchaeota archaeon]|nr:translation initiation factor IF-2 subunit alpha [Candidatus Woesearchaeota archaeon]